MAIAHVRQVGTAANKAGTTAAVTVATDPVPVGNLIVVFVSCRGASADLSCSDSRGNTYTEQKNHFPASGVPEGSIFVSRITIQLEVNDTITIDTAESGVAKAMIVREFSGVDDVRDQHNATDGNSLTPSVTSGTTTTANQLASAMVGVEGPSGDLFTQDTLNGWTGSRVGTSGGSAASNITISGVYKILSATGAQTYAPTLGTSRVWVDLIVTLQEPSGVVEKSGTDSATATEDAVTLAAEVQASDSAILSDSSALDTGPIQKIAADTFVFGDDDCLYPHDSVLPGSDTSPGCASIAVVSPLASETFTLTDTASIDAGEPPAEQKSGSDSFAESEGTASITAQVTPTESATLSDSASLSAAASASDSATESEGASQIGLSSSDSASVSEGAPSVAVDVNASDSGAWAEGTPQVGLSATDSGALSETSAISEVASISATDSVSASEGTPQIGVPGTDAGTSSESTSSQAQVSASDSVALSETASVDTGATQISGTDAFSFTEAASVSVQVVTADIANAIEGAQVTVTLTVTDSAAASEAGSAQASQEFQGADSAGVMESVSLSVAVAVNEGLALSDQGSLAATLAAIDSAALTESTLAGDIGPLPFVDGSAGIQDGREGRAGLLVVGEGVSGSSARKESTAGVSATIDH